jgi:hypothetical protein
MSESSRIESYLNSGTAFALLGLGRGIASGKAQERNPGAFLGSWAGPDGVEIEPVRLHCDIAQAMVEGKAYGETTILLVSPTARANGLTIDGCGVDFYGYFVPYFPVSADDVRRVLADCAIEYGGATAERLPDGRYLVFVACVDD